MHGPYGGTLLIRKCPPPQDHHRALGISLLQGPRGMRFLMREVPLYGGVDLRAARFVIEGEERACTTFRTSITFKGAFTTSFTTRTGAASSRLGARRRQTVGVRGGGRKMSLAQGGRGVRCPWR